MSGDADALGNEEIRAILVRYYDEFLRPEFEWMHEQFAAIDHQQTLIAANLQGLLDRFDRMLDRGTMPP